MRKLTWIIVLGFVGLALAKDNDLPPVKPFSVVKYMGKWHELARLPNFFEKGLEQPTAEFYRDEDGRLRVRNEGLKTSSQEMTSVEGFVRFKDAEDVGALEVSFFRPFYATYRVVKLVGDYQVAVVVSDGMDDLWIMSRSPTIDKAVLKGLLDEMKAKGFDTSKLILANGVEQ